MSYCIYEKDIKNNKSVVRNTLSPDNYFKDIIGKISWKHDATILKNISKDAVFINDFFEPGMYALINGNKIELVDKNIKMDNLFSWKLLSYDTHIDEGIKLNEFNLDNMCPNPHILIIGKRGSGKSQLIGNILTKLGLAGNTTIISPTERMNVEYSKRFLNAQIHFTITEDVVKNVLQKQTVMMDKQKKYENINPSGIFVMDDCLAQKGNWREMQSIKEIMMNSRHYALTNITAMQSPIDLPPEMRLNFDYIFLFKEDSAINRKKIWMNYASMFPSIDEFEKVFSKATEGFGTMVINNRSQSHDINKQVYQFTSTQ